MRQEKSCGAVIIKRNHGKVHCVLIQHLAGSHWDFPKGHVEKGETEEETALREVKEETGLLVTLVPGFRFEMKYMSDPKTQKTVVFFLAQELEGTLKKQDIEIKAIGWFEREKVEKNLTYENSKKLFRSAMKFLDETNAGLVN